MKHWEAHFGVAVVLRHRDQLRPLPWRAQSSCASATSSKPASRVDGSTRAQLAAVDQLPSIMPNDAVLLPRCLLLVLHDTDAANHQRPCGDVPGVMDDTERLKAFISSSLDLTKCLNELRRGVRLVGAASQTPRRLHSVDRWMRHMPSTASGAPGRRAERSRRFAGPYRVEKPKAPFETLPIVSQLSADR